MNADPKSAKAIFLEAVERHAPDQWPAFLERACAGQPELRGWVEALLEAHREVGTDRHRDLAEGTDAGPVATVDVPPVREHPGAVIGPYKLLEQIGEGGLGVVFLAEQTEPVRRKVALKVIKPGMDTRRWSPGSRPSGRPWRSWTTPTSPGSSTAAPPPPAGPTSSWSWSRACPITEFCDQNHLTPAAAAGAVRPGLPGGAARPPEGDHPPRPQALQRPRQPCTTRPRW